MENFSDQASMIYKNKYQCGQNDCYSANVIKFEVKKVVSCFIAIMVIKSTKSRENGYNKSQNSRKHLKICNLMNFNLQQGFDLKVDIYIRSAQRLDYVKYSITYFIHTL